MTEPIESTPEAEAVPVPAPEPEAPEPATESDAPDDSEFDPRARKALATLRHEAATNRIALKEAKQTIATLEGAVTRLAALERVEIERVAAEQLIDAEDVWRVSPDVQQSWYDEKFSQLQPDKVRESIEALIQAKPHLARAATPPPSQRPIESLRAGASPEPKETKVTWNSALRRAGI